MKKGIKILIIEDEKAIVELYEERFALEEGIKTLKAYTGKEGLEVLKSWKTDLILLDILMPEMNGFEFLKEVKKIKEAKNVPVLLLTNLGESKIDMNKELAFALGIQGYLIKSKNTPDQVVNKVYQTLGIK